MSRIIDIHGHLGEYGLFHSPKNGADDLVRRLDALGVERLLLSSNAAFASDYRFGNDQTAEALARHPGRLFGYAVANPNYPEETEQELERCLSKPGFVGVKLHPATHDYPLDGPGYGPALKWAEARKLPVLVHFWFGHPRCGDGHVRHTVSAHPGVRLILAHLGGLDAAYRGIPALAREFPSLTFDTACSRSPRGVLEFLVEQGLEDRLVYGSDMPFIDPGAQLGKALFAAIPESARTKILCDNACRLMGW